MMSVKDENCSNSMKINEAVVVIHRRSVMRSDQALRQFFVDDNLDLRLGNLTLLSTGYRPEMAATSKTQGKRNAIDTLPIITSRLNKPHAQPAEK